MIEMLAFFLEINQRDSAQHLSDSSSFIPGLYLQGLFPVSKATFIKQAIGRIEFTYGYFLKVATIYNWYDGLQMGSDVIIWFVSRTLDIDKFKVLRPPMYNHYSILRINYLQEIREYTSKAISVHIPF